MNYAYAKKKAAPVPEAVPSSPTEERFGSGVSMDAMRDALGINSVDRHRVDLQDAMRAKMEKAFGMDLRSLRLYESEKVDKAGANALAQGNTIVFAPGKLDQSSHEGQALLGHELSHLAARARGKVTGSGFLDSPYLEGQADREGAMAAAGQAVYSGPVTGTVSAALSAGGPIQADKKTPEQKKKEKEEKRKQEKKAQRAAALASVTLPSQQPSTVKDNKFVPAALAGINSGASTAASQFGSFAKERVKDLEALEEGKSEEPTGFAPYDWYKDTRKKAVAGAFNGIGLDTAEKLEKASKISAASKSGLGMLSGVQKMSGTYAGIEKAEEAGDTQAVTDKKLTLAQQGVGVLKSGASMGKSIASMFGSPAAGLAKVGLGYATTGLGMAGSGIGAVKDTHDLYKEHSLRSNMRKQRNAILERTKGKELSDEEAELMETQQQAIDHSKGRSVRAGASLVGNVLGVGAGAVEIASLAGGVSAPAAAAVGTALGGIQTGVNYAGSAVADYQDFKAKRDTAERKYHAKDEAAKLKAQAEDAEQNGSGPIDLATMFDESKAREMRKMELAGKLSRNQLRKAQLIAHGVKSGTYDEANDRLALERSKKYTAGAKAGDAASVSLLQGMNIDAAAEGAQNTMYKKLGGSDMLSESEDNYRRWNDNDFEAAAQANAESAEIIRKVGKGTYYGNLIKTKVKNFGADTWKSTKSGAKRLGKLAAAPFKASWRGMKKVGGGIKDFATSKDTRKKAWESIKAAPGKAWDSIKTGVNKAGKAIASAPGKVAEGVKALPGKVKELPGRISRGVTTGARNVAEYTKYKAGKVSSWYKRGVDQMNMYGDTYEKMGMLDRAAWSMKNLPARLTHSLAFNKERSEKRKQKYTDRDELARNLKEEEEEKKRAQGQ